MSRQRPLTSSWLAVPTSTTAIVTLGRKSEGVREIRDWHATSTKGIIIIVYVLIVILFLCIRTVQLFYLRIRPYSVECTRSRSISEVKQLQAGLVLGWVTAWEYPVPYPFAFWSGFVYLDRQINRISPKKWADRLFCKFRHFLATKNDQKSGRTVILLQIPYSKISPKFIQISSFFIFKKAKTPILLLLQNNIFVK